jgi:hypothetical protein
MKEEKQDIHPIALPVADFCTNHPLLSAILDMQTDLSVQDDQTRCCCGIV